MMHGLGFEHGHFEEGWGAPPIALHDFAGDLDELQPHAELLLDGGSGEAEIHLEFPGEAVALTASSVDIKLTKFLPSLAEVPSKELEVLKQRVIKSGFDFIDFWAVDFDWNPDKPFNHHWQDYRTRKDRSLKTVSDAGHSYPRPGTYTACVKVVDVFGCDTSITVEVKI